MTELMNKPTQTPIEIAMQIDDEGFTTARRLFAWLEFEPSHYARWLKDYITDNPFADEKEFSPLMAKTSKIGGRPSLDYRISVTLAKKIAMMAKTERGEQARNYFVGCEQALAKLAEQARRTEIERAKGIAVRQALTKAIQVSSENERMHGHAYSTYTDVIYRSIFNKSAKQLREEYKITKDDSLRDCFTEEELNQIRRAEMLVSSLVEYGWGYNEIKDFINTQAAKRVEEKQD